MKSNDKKPNGKTSNTPPILAKEVAKDKSIDYQKYIDERREKAIKALGPQKVTSSDGLIHIPNIHRDYYLNELISWILTDNLHLNNLNTDKDIVIEAVGYESLPYFKLIKEVADDNYKIDTAIPPPNANGRILNVFNYKPLDASSLKLIFSNHSFTDYSQSRSNWLFLSRILRAITYHFDDFIWLLVERFGLEDKYDENSSATTFVCIKKVLEN